jgi:long-chain fatty acid transport protein
MTNSSQRLLRVSACALLIGMAGAAQATEGYFQEGVSPREKALGGAGVADSRDALTIANNPAGLAFVGHQLSIGLSAFSPSREYSATGTAAVPPGGLKSSREMFAIPAIGYSMPIDATSGWGVAIYGNGGMNTDYRGRNAACGGAVGVFCAGKTGVDLNQAFISVGYGKSFGNLSVGIAPVVGVQMFKAYGIAPFAAFSSAPTAFSDNGYSSAVGAGVRAGAQYRVTDTFRVGLSGSTPIWMGKFDKYRGLFAGAGSFDVPGNITVGLAWDVLPTFTLLLDYKHIFYSGVKSIANSSRNPFPFGWSNGPGFGWKDVDVVSLGAEWRATRDLTLRAGYAHNTNPVRSRDVTLNILAPGVVTDHFTAGLSYALTRNASIEFAAVYVPKHTVTGPDMANTGVVKLSMSQFEATVGLTYKFGAPAPVVAKY